MKIALLSKHCRKWHFQQIRCPRCFHNKQVSPKCSLPEDAPNDNFFISSFSIHPKLDWLAQMKPLKGKKVPVYTSINRICGETATTRGTVNKRCLLLDSYILRKRIFLTTFFKYVSYVELFNLPSQPITLKYSYQFTDKIQKYCKNTKTCSKSFVESLLFF